MYRKTLFQRGIWAILAALLLIGCSATADDQIIVTFDGNECSVSGSTELTVGEHPFILKNLTEDNLSIIIARLLDEHTFQDLKNRIEEQGHEWPESGSNWPDWFDASSNTRFVDFEKDDSKGEERITLSIRQDGAYAITIYNTTDQTMWSCAPLTVVASPSE